MLGMTIVIANGAMATVAWWSALCCGGLAIVEASTADIVEFRNCNVRNAFG